MPLSLSSIQTQWSNAVKPLQELRKFAALHTVAGDHLNVGDNYLNMESTLVSSLEGDYAAEKISAMLGFRSRLNSALASATSVIAPHILEYGKFISMPETDLQVLMTRIWDYMIDHNLYVSSREFTFGTPTADVGNIGSGTIVRLNTDESGYDIENQSGITAGGGMLKMAECTSDKNSGSYQGNEAFLFYGAAPDRDDLRINGLRGSAVINGLSAIDSQTFISNPSFESTSGTDGAVFTAATQLTGWTMSAFALFMPISSDYYRAYSRITTPRSLRFTTNASITQVMDRSNAQSRLPLYVHVAFKREASCDGTLTLTFGSKTATVNLGAAPAGWQTLVLGPGTANWLKNWNVNAPAITVALSGRTIGTLLVDDVIIAPFTPFDGGWYAILGGATPFLKQDAFSWRDYVPVTEGILQYWNYRALGRYLPCINSSAATWVDP
jgi:hypothetical protein